MTLTTKEIDNYQKIKFKDLLKKFENIGFNKKFFYLENININSYIYCSYNYTGNIDVFFKSYDKILKHEKINILYEYGNVINGKFIINNISGSAKIYFIATGDDVKDNIVKGKYLKKSVEIYKVIDNDGNQISEEKRTEASGFETDFFNRPEIKVVLRKSKLQKLKNKDNKNIFFKSC